MQILSKLLLASSLGAIVQGQLNTGEASGQIRSIANGSKFYHKTANEHEPGLIKYITAQVYFTGPPDSETGVLFLTDIFGINFINTQLVADSYGARGFVHPLSYRPSAIPNNPTNFHTQLLHHSAGPLPRRPSTR